MKSFAILSVLATVVAVSAADSNSSSTANPLIPTGISSGCSGFLSTFNTNSSIAACVKPIVDATSQFGPSSSNASSNASVSAALSELCNLGDCSQTIRSALSDFYTACTAELTSSVNHDVLVTYDSLYVLTPFVNAACAKDDNGKACITQIQTSGSNSTGSSKEAASNGGKIALLQNNLYSSYDTSALSRRATVTQNVSAALVPNTTTFRTTGLAFLLLTPDMSANQLCVSCTRQILSAYINFEQSVPYAPGLASSPILGGQSALYNAVNSTCGASFMSGAVQAAGGLGSGLLSGAMSITPDTLSSLVTVLAAAGAGLAAFF